MLRTMEINNSFVFLKDLEVLKFIQQRKKDILFQIGDRSLLYNNIFDGDTIYGGSQYRIITEKSITDYSSRINIFDLLLLPFNISYCNCIMDDAQINVDYLEYLNNTLDTSYNAEECLSYYYDYENDITIDNEDETSIKEIFEYVVTSSKIDKFLDKNINNENKMKLFKYYLKFLGELIDYSDESSIDIRTSDNLYFHKDLFDNCRYQICYIKASNKYSCPQSSELLSDILGNILNLNIFLEKEGV